MALSGCGGGVAWAHWNPGEPKSYMASPTNEAVHDSVTGLTWQRDVPAEVFTWQKAKDYCDALILDASCDWRLPSRIELVSIVDYVLSNPAINAAAFPGTPSEYFWSSSPNALFSFAGWRVDFSDGAVNAISGDDMNNTFRVRCVR